MFNRRRFLTTTAASGIGIGLAPGLLGAQPSEPQPEKLVVIISSSYAEVMDTFGREYTEITGIPIEVVSQSYDTTYTKIATQLAGGAPTDIVICDSIWMSAFVNAGFLLSVDDRVAPFADEIVPAALEQRRIDGEIYAMPFSNEGKFLYFNTEAISAAGLTSVPETWDAAMEAMPAFTEAGYTPSIWGWAQAEGLICDFTLMVKAMGGDVASPEGVWLADRDACVAAAAQMARMLETGFADPASTSLSDREVVDSFGGGQHAMVVSWSFAYSVLNSPETSAIPGRVEIGLIPGSEVARTRSATCLGGSAFGISATSQSPDWAWDFIQFISNREHQIAIYDIRSNVPVWNDLYQSAEVEEQFPFIGQMREQFDYSAWRPNTPNYAEQSAQLQRYLHACLNGQITAEEAIDQAAAAIASL